MAQASREGAHRVPKQFLCPISKKFMKEPVIAPLTQQTCDYNSLVSLSTNNSRPSSDEDELLMPDHHLRWQNSAWLSKYNRRPPFAYISTPADLETAVTSLLIPRDENDILEDSDLLNNLRQLNSAIQGKTSIVNSGLGFSSVLRLIAECPVYFNHVLEWVKLSVGILAQAHNIDDQNPILYAHYRSLVLLIINSVIAEIHDAAFQLGLVNLLNPFMVLPDSKQMIISHGGIIEALSSYILRPTHRRFESSRHNFYHLLNLIMGLWATEDGLKQPRLSQAVTSLVWPMHEQMNNSQYHYLTHTISFVLHWQDDLDCNDVDLYIEGSLDLLTRAGLVTRIFQVLQYAILPDEEKAQNPYGWFSSGEITSTGEENHVIMRCFEILSSLSSVSVGRLEIVRVIERSGYIFLEVFYSALRRTSAIHYSDTHVVPALSVLLNLMEHTRYTPLFDRTESPGVQEFLSLREDFLNYNHPRISIIITDLFASYNQIKTEEEDLPVGMY